MQQISDIRALVCANRYGPVQKRARQTDDHPENKQDQKPESMNKFNIDMGLPFALVKKSSK